MSIYKSLCSKFNNLSDKYSYEAAIATGGCMALVTLPGGLVEKVIAGGLGIISGAVVYNGMRVRSAEHDKNTRHPAVT